MNPVRLARIAAEAESVRLRGMASRIARRVIFLVVAAFFVIGAVVFGHIAAWYWIRIDRDMSFYAAAGILGGVDLLIALILVVLGSRSTPSHVEVQALEVRQKAVAGMTSVLTLSQLALPVLRVATAFGRRRRRV